MLSPLESAAHRFSSFAKEVIEPAVHPDRAPLDAAVYQCAEPITPEQAAEASYQPVEIGWRWGPVWSTAWFRVTGRVPPRMAGRPVALRFFSGTEALLYDGDAALQGFDVNRDSHLLFRVAEGDEPIDLLVEAACNQPHGITTFWWDPPETHARWASDTPGLLERCELAVYDEAVWRLWQTYDFARRLLSELREDDPRAQALREALSTATRLIDDCDVAAGAVEATELLHRTLHSGAPDSASRCFAVGHAHIDTAWLWPIRETRRKCRRTFANALGLMDRYPDFRFLCSQPQQYAWIEADAPDLFARIAERVREGRWEAAGAMWIEPDCNVPSGESLVRQVVHGVRYFRDRFGDAAPQRVLYLPDTFGFAASIPQIMKLSGLDTFITNKLSWNETNEFPHVSFRWRGIDGTEVLAHCTPGHDYNAHLTPLELRRGAANVARKDRASTGAWLQPYGFGDGGGGPTDAMIERARLAGGAEGLPRVTLSGAGSFCDELHRARRALLETGRDLPAWDGELYLELHRGTLTTQAWLKRANRRAEESLRAVEWLAFAAPAALDAREAEALTARLDETWKLVLLNQFHDILPGTSIAPVYVDAREQHDRVRLFYEDAVESAAARWATQVDAGGLTEPMVVFNPTSTAASGVVDFDGGLHHVEDVPPLGVRVIDRARAKIEEETVPAGDDRLSNGLIETRIDEAGRITRLRRAGSDRDACGRDATGAPVPLNQLVLYEDRPRSWEAWDIDAEHVEKARPVTGDGAERTLIENTQLRATIEVAQPLGERSRITQLFRLEAGSPRLDIETWVDWREDHRLLRALFPTSVRARHATAAIPFGHLERPTHRNTPWDEAMFEVCAHAWMDLSEDGFGLALLNDGKYGHSCDGAVLGLSLLRATGFPDPGADRGDHRFTYSLMVHDGDWRAAGVDRAAALLNAPLFARPVRAGQDGVIGDTWAPFSIGGPRAAGVVVAAFKRAEADDRRILRLVETHGGGGGITIDWRIPVGDVEPVDLLEEAMELDGFEHDASAGRTTIRLRAFQIVTLALDASA